MSIIRKNSIFVITDGEYSNYDMITICKAKQDIDIVALEQEYIGLHPEEKRSYLFSKYRFVKWLIVDRCLCDEIDYTEFHLGSYYSVTPRFSIGGKIDWSND